MIKANFILQYTNRLAAFRYSNVRNKKKIDLTDCYKTYSVDTGSRKNENIY